MEYTLYYYWNKIYEDIYAITKNKENYSTLLNLIKTNNLPLQIVKQFENIDIHQIKNNILEDLTDEYLESSMKFIHKNLTAYIKQNEIEYLRRR